MEVIHFEICMCLVLGLFLMCLDGKGLRARYDLVSHDVQKHSVIWRVNRGEWGLGNTPLSWHPKTLLEYAVWQGTL